MLLSIMSFKTEEASPSKSWVFSNRPDALSWLTIQSGLKILIAQLQPCLPRSMWLPVFLDADDEIFIYTDETPGPVGLPEAFVELCDIDEETTIDTNPYHLALRKLAPLLELKPSLATFVKLIAFMGRIAPAFTRLLLAKDARALLIISYWFALMCSVDLWWVHGRVQSECVAICMVLEGHPDNRIRQLLRYPASVCGYTITSKAV